MKGIRLLFVFCISFICFHAWKNIYSYLYKNFENTRGKFRRRLEIKLKVQVKGKGKGKSKGKGKGKVIPLQAWTGPEGSRRLRLPDINTIGT
jgi:hypothetical protein